MKTILSGIFNWILQPFSWSRWVDISTFGFGGAPYLLQGKVNTLSYAKKFRITAMKQGWWVTAEAGNVSIEKLKELGL